MSSACEALVTCAPDSTALALEELESSGLCRADPQSCAPGVLLVGLRTSFDELAARWRDRPPVFIRHLAPCRLHVPVRDDPADIDGLCRAALSLSERLDPSAPFSVQCRLLTPHVYRPFQVITAIAEALTARTGAPVDVRTPQQVLSLAIGDTEAYMGLSRADDNLSNWAGGARRFAREPGQVSRAEFKLLEALEVFRIDMPAQGRALDLGAAPGGWTRVLLQKGLRVVAVDPAQLAPAIASDPRVEHRACTAEQMARYQPGVFEVLVNDMRQDARDSARIMNASAAFLAETGVAVMTLKLPRKGTRKVLKAALQILRESYQVTGVRQLFHNRSEATVCLRKR